MKRYTTFVCIREWFTNGCNSAAPNSARGRFVLCVQNRGLVRTGRSIRVQFGPRPFWETKRGFSMLSVFVVSFYVAFVLPPQSSSSSRVSVLSVSMMLIVLVTSTQLCIQTLFLKNRNFHHLLSTHFRRISSRRMQTKIPSEAHANLSYRPPKLEKEPRPNTTPTPFSLHWLGTCQKILSPPSSWLVLSPLVQSRGSKVPHQNGTLSFENQGTPPGRRTTYGKPGKRARHSLLSIWGRKFGG